MSLEKLKDEIQASAESEVRKILDAAKKDAQAIISRAETESVALKESIKNEALEQMKLERVRISAAKLNAKKIIAEAKEQIVKKTFACLEDELRTFSKSKDYRPFVEKLIKKNSKDFAVSDFVVLARKGDERIISAMNLSFKPIDGETIGGVIIKSKDGSVKIDCTFEALIRENEDELRQKAYSTLFQG